MEPRDTLWQSCLRELEEETALPLNTDTLQTACKAWKCLTTPTAACAGAPSPVFVFHVPGTQLPTVQGGDDAATARWVPLRDLPGLETQMFEDHFHVLRRCLARFGSAGLPVALP